MQTEFMNRLSKAARGGVAAAHKCRLLTKDKPIVHVFVEGFVDGPFYRPFFVNRYPGYEVMVFVAEGRDEVFRARNSLGEAFLSKNNVVFLIDRDFSDFLEPAQEIPNDVFVTCFYSVESYLIDTATLRLVFSVFGGCDWSDEYSCRFKTLFNHFLADCSRQLRFLMALVIALRQDNKKINLSNVNINNLFEVGPDGSVKGKRGRNRNFINKCKPEDISIDVKNLKCIARELKAKDPRTWIRGKYLLSLFLKLLEIIYREGQDAALAAELGLPKSRFAPPQNADDLIRICSGHVRCPDRFALFLSDFSARLHRP